MTTTEPLPWCPACGIHRTQAATCPVCTDRAAKDAEAKLVLLGWGLRRPRWANETGGRV